MKKIYPSSPDNYILNLEDQYVIRAGHLNYVIDELNGDSTSGTAAPNVTVTEYNSGKFKITELTFTDLVVGSLPAAAVSKAIGVLIYTLPAGVQVTDITYMSVGFTGTGTANTPDVGIGSTIASGANALLSAAGATTEDYITGQTATDITGTAVVATAVPAAAMTINTSAEVKTIHLNAAGAWAVGNTGNLTATGKIVIKWTQIS